MSRPVCSECLCVIDETGCGCVHPIEPFTNHEQGEKMNANELMPQLEELKVEVLKLIEKNTQQQALIEQLEETQEYLYKTHDADKAEIEALKAKDLKKSMAIRSLNTQLKKALQYETYSR